VTNDDLHGEQDVTARRALQQLDREIHESLTVDYEAGLRDVHARVNARSERRTWRGLLLRWIGSLVVIQNLAVAVLRAAGDDRLERGSPARPDTETGTNGALPSAELKVDDGAEPKPHGWFDVSRGRPAKARWLVTVAVAAVCVFAAGTAVGAGLFDRETSNPPAARGEPTQPSARPSPSGCCLAISGEQFEGTNPTTGVNAKLGLESKVWGTQVDMELSRIRGPLNAILVAVSKSGTAATAMTWTVPATGYGTAEQPDPLKLQGGTAIQRNEIYRFEVRTWDGSTLLVIRVS